MQILLARLATSPVVAEALEALVVATLLAGVTMLNDSYVDYRSKSIANKILKIK